MDNLDMQISLFFQLTVTLAKRLIQFFVDFRVRDPKAFDEMEQIELTHDTFPEKDLLHPKKH